MGSATLGYVPPQSANPLFGSQAPISFAQSMPAYQQPFLVPPTQPVSQASVVDALCTQLALSRLPTPEPPIFSGDPLKYGAWKRSFETLISSKSIPPQECIHYLDKYISGEARESIEGVFMIGSPQAYADAFKILDKRFGDSFVVGNAF